MKTMKNMPVCDLRSYLTAEAAQDIGEIRNVAVVVLPKDASDEVRQALHSIPMENVASVIELEKDARLRIINGVSEIGESDLGTSETNALIINGVSLFTDITPESRAILFLNGVAIINARLKSHPGLEFALVNGVRLFAEFDAYKWFPDKIEVDRDFLTWLAPGIAVIAGNKIRIAEDVTMDLLQEKKTTFIAGNKIECPAAILGYVKSVSKVGNKVIVRGADAESDEKGNEDGNGDRDAD
ncbi:MAG: hypothetical protein KBA30_06850 [Clostridia bacterium]|nr:hypothetical protein [Clostridia bacterium]